VIAWGIYGYDKMPKRKALDISVKEAQAICVISGDLPQWINLEYSQSKLAAYGITPSKVSQVLSARSIVSVTFGFMDLVGWDIPQVSIASLTIAPGLLIDDPVVAGDAIKRDLDAGQVLDAGIERLRPVLITVGAAVLALVPLSIRGGPLWEPLCYAQIGGLSAAIPLRSGLEG
jgi:hypothetical protein